MPRSPPTRCSPACRSTVEAHLADARGALEGSGAADGSAYVWNIDGYDNIIARADALIAGARERLARRLWSSESLRLSPALAAAEERGVQILILCVQGCANECGGCCGDIYRYPVSQPTRTAAG